MSFERTTDSFKKIIIVEKSMKPRYDENGYLMMGVKEFYWMQTACLSESVIKSSCVATLSITNHIIHIQYRILR